MSNFAGWVFLGGGNLRSDLDHLILKQSLKKHSVNDEHQSQNYHELPVQRV